MSGVRNGAGVDSVAGFVLTGGRSSRMGQDKALLPFGNRTLLEHVASIVHQAAGSVALIGPPERYAQFGFPVHGDLVQDCGPLGGLYTALKLTHSEWNLMVGCDMPGLTPEFLSDLLRSARHADADCLVPQTASGLHPLCAVYHRRALGAVESALSRKSLKMHDLLSHLQTVRFPLENSALVDNVNTPADWGIYESSPIKQ